MQPFLKIHVVLLLWAVLTTGSQAAEPTTVVCPEIPAGAIVLGRYCRAEVHAALDTAPVLERKENSPPAPILIATPSAGAAIPSSPVAIVVTPLQTATPKPATVQPLFIRQGERLMPTLKLWLANQSMELVWAAPASTSGRVRDVVMDDDFQASSQDLRAVLSEVLEPFGFEAEIATNSGALQRITVRNARNGF